MSSPSLPRTPRRLLVPEEGPKSPLFSLVEAADTVEATVLFRGTLSEEQLDEAERALLGWFAGAEWGGRLPILVAETLTTSCLHVAVTGVRTAEHALGLLLDALAGTGVPMARAVFARLRADGDRDALVRGMDPGARAQVEYDDPGEWWRACFDPNAAPPLSEDRAELARDDNALLETGRTTFAERRGLPLHVREMRICYGLGEGAFEETPSERASEIARALRVAIKERFGPGESGAAPSAYNRRHETDAPLDAMRAGGKVGYSCAFHATDLREFLHDHLFRYREYELMLAVRDVIRALSLEPVVCWRRFQGRYVIQLWERGASQVHQAA
ncbi:MAG: hypothetical protein ACLQVI_30780 [Polyangiaceae bacterium]|jgi:hypothetical protein